MPARSKKASDKTVGFSNCELRRILVIDDDIDVVELLRYCVSRNWPGAAIDVYDLAQGRPPGNFPWKNYDLLLLDLELGLEGENGFDWLRALRKNSNLPATVMITGHGDEDTAVQALKLGADDYMNKETLSPKRFLECVDSCLRMRGWDTDDIRGRGFIGVGDDSVDAHHGRFNNISADPRKFPLKVPGYRLLGQLAQGGMASIYLAETVEGSRTVALKILYSQDDENTDLLYRFMAEYRFLGQLAHPNVAKIYERGFASDFAYIAMEYCPGGDLSDRLKKPLAPETAADYLRDIAKGLDAVHDLNLIHRDLKPANVLFRADDSLALTDFGVAKAVRGASSICVTDGTLGTPFYMSPERFRDGVASELSDLYSLGVMFCEMLIGKRPYTTMNMVRLMNLHQNAPIPRLPERCAHLQPVLDGLMAKDPSDRFQSTRELLMGLDWVRG